MLYETADGETVLTITGGCQDVMDSRLEELLTMNYVISPLLVPRNPC